MMKIHKSTARATEKCEWIMTFSYVAADDDVSVGRGMERRGSAGAEGSRNNTT